MRIWDVNPGYLNRQSLLGEHREIHAMVAILTDEKTGYARHPETRRWAKALWALQMRHDLVVSEMALRGYQHRTPVLTSGDQAWPEAFIDSPGRQFTMLRTTYRHRARGRIPLRRTLQQLWAQHKYSVLARNPEYYHSIGTRVAARNSGTSLEQLARELVGILRVPPLEGRLVNALQHMWGYVSEFARLTAADWQRPLAVLTAIRTLTITHQVRYLLESTALSELSVWIHDGDTGPGSIAQACRGSLGTGAGGWARAASAGSASPRHAADAVNRAADAGAVGRPPGVADSAREYGPGPIARGDVMLSTDAFFDEQAMRTLVLVQFGGADFGECLVTMQRVPPGDAAAWHREWTATADRVAAIGDACAAAGRQISAREAYLRAANYFRTSYLLLYGAPPTPALVRAFERESATFRAFASRGSAA
jgi:uncharacterized protein YbgA (DUF1722 family)